MATNCILQLPAIGGRVKVISSVEIDGQQYPAIMVISPHGITIIEISTNQVLKSYEFQRLAENAISDAVYMHSIRSFVISFLDSTITLIPPKCVDPNRLPRTKLREGLTALCIGGEDVVIGWTQEGRVCELPVFSGRLPEDDNIPKKSKESSSGKSKDNSRIGCLVGGTGVVSVAGKNLVGAGNIKYDLVKYTYNLSSSHLISRPVLNWINSEPREIAISAIDATPSASWCVMSVCEDPVALGYAIMVLSVFGYSESSKKSKKKNKDKQGGDATASSSPSATRSPHYLVKFEVATSKVVYARPISVPMPPAVTGKRKRSESSDNDFLNSSPMHLTVVGSLICLVWSHGVCEFVNPHYGTHVTCPLRISTDSFSCPSPQSVRFSVPGLCDESINRRGSFDLPDMSEAVERVVSIAMSLVPDTPNVYSCYTVTSKGVDSIQVNSTAVTLGGQGSALDGHKSFLQKDVNYCSSTLCAALGSLQSPASENATSVGATTSADGLLSSLSRTQRRRLAIAQGIIADELESHRNISDSAALVPATPVAPARSSTASQTKRPLSGSTPAVATINGAVATTDAPPAPSSRQSSYVGMGRVKSAAKVYLDNNFDAVEAFVRQLDLVLASPDPASKFMSSDWATLQVVLHSESVSIQKRPSLLDVVYSAQRIDALADIAQYAPDLTEAQAVSILLYSINCSDDVLDRYCLASGYLKARGKNDTGFIRRRQAATAGSSSGEMALVATPSSKKSSKKKVAAGGVDGPIDSSAAWNPSPFESRKIILFIFMRALLYRKCAFCVPTLISALKALSHEASSILLHAITSMLDGCCCFSSHPEARVVEDNIIQNFGDRQLSASLCWIEALLDSHYGTFAMSLSSLGKVSEIEEEEREESARDRSVKIAASGLKKLVSLTANAEQTLTELEKTFGLWTHISRSSKNSSSAIGESASAGVFFAGGGSAMYQVETLRL